MESIIKINQNMFHRYPAEVPVAWFKKAGDIYPDLVIDNHDEVIRQMGFPSNWRVVLRWKNLSPDKLQKDTVTIDIFDKYNEDTESYKAIVYVPRKLAMSYPLEKLKRELEQLELFSKVPPRITWDTENNVWKLSTFAEDKSAFDCTELYPLIHRFKDDFASMSQWMKIDAGYVKTSVGPNGAWVYDKDSENQNT